MPDFEYLKSDVARIWLTSANGYFVAEFTRADIVWLQQDAAFCYACADKYRDHLNPSTDGHMAQQYPGHGEGMAVQAQEAAAHSAKLARITMGMPE